MKALKNDKKLSDITVDEFTSPVSVFADQDTSIPVIRELMDENGIRHVPIIENGVAIGLITDRDLKVIVNINLYEELFAKDIMIHNPFTVITGSTLEDVIFDMSENKLGSVLIEDSEGQCIGIFTYIDAMNALIEILRGDDL